jgi:cytochrome c peroxidase
VVKPYPDASDPGRFRVTQNEGDRMMFKVPSLRNVAQTGPYFHNGSVASIEEAVVQMGEYQLAKTLKADEVASIIAFLKALTGEVPAEYIRKPELPKSVAMPQPRG